MGARPISLHAAVWLLAGLIHDNAVGPYALYSYMTTGSRASLLVVPPELGCRSAQTASLLKRISRAGPAPSLPRHCRQPPASQLVPSLACFFCCHTFASSHVAESHASDTPTFATLQRHAILPAATPRHGSLLEVATHEHPCHNSPASSGDLIPPSPARSACGGRTSKACPLADQRVLIPPVCTPRHCDRPYFPTHGITRFREQECHHEPVFAHLSHCVAS
jgi:hypothetical protein